MEKALKQAKKINEDILIWADIQQVLSEQVKKRTPEELESQATSAEIFWKVYFEKEMRGIIAQQVDFMGKNIENNEQLLWIRGVLAGLDIVKSWFEAQNNLSMSRFNKENQ